ncbi:MAG: hypothetical protein Q7S74_05955 [Nanoarchaeota archaeon]|nr:hypothetical protein [Nanoarchaeota archaeon]
MKLKNITRKAKLSIALALAGTSLFSTGCDPEEFYAYLGSGEFSMDSIGFIDKGSVADRGFRIPIQTPQNPGDYFRQIRYDPGGPGEPHHINYDLRQMNPDGRLGRQLSDYHRIPLPTGAQIMAGGMITNAVLGTFSQIVLGGQEMQDYNRCRNSIRGDCYQYLNRGLQYYSQAAWAGTR